jgi:uncharacterized SAM-binding protein YcdF (DUF218 family)
MKRTLRFTARTVAAVAALLGTGIVLTFAVALIVVVTGFKGNAVLPADCALVFGAAVYGYDRPGPAIVRRISTANRLYNEKLVQKLIVAGGVGRGGGESLSEASVMRAEAMENGVHSNNILVEEQSHSTLENLLFSKELAKSCNSVVGISDAYHLTRIRLLAFQQGWEHFTVYPADLRPPVMSELKSIGREVFGVLYYGLYIDRIIDIPPAHGRL